MNDRVSRRKQLVDRGLPPQHGEVGSTIRQKRIDLRRRRRGCCFFGELQIAKRFVRAACKVLAERVGLELRGRLEQLAIQPKHRSALRGGAHESGKSNRH